MLGQEKNKRYFLLDANGANYLQWTNFVTIRLGEKGLIGLVIDNIINESDDAEKKSIKRYQALRIITDNLSKELVIKFSKCTSPQEIWNTLKTKFDDIRHQLPMAINDWENLYVGDYKTIQEYDNALSEITVRLMNCGEENMVTEKALI